MHGGHKLGISQCYDNVTRCNISGGVVVDDQRFLSYEDSGFYFCRDAETAEEYYVNLTVLGKLSVGPDGIHQCTHLMSQFTILLIL